MEMKHARTFSFFFHFTYVEKQRSKKTRTMESTLKEALCNWLRKLPKRNVAFLCKAQCANTQFGDGSASSTCRRTELAESNGGDGLRFASAPIGGIVVNIIYKIDSKIGFEMNLIVVEAIRGRCASFTVLTATVSEIFGGQTTPSILVV